MLIAALLSLLLITMSEGFICGRFHATHGGVVGHGLWVEDTFVCVCECGGGSRDSRDSVV